MTACNTKPKYYKKLIKYETLFEAIKNKTVTHLLKYSDS